jgi:hypothetical protein
MRRFLSGILALLGAIAWPALAAGQEPTQEARPAQEAQPPPKAPPAEEAQPPPRGQPAPEAQPTPASGSTEPSVPEAGEKKKLTTGKVVLLVLLGEGLIAGMSGAAAYAPGYVGVVEAVSAPLAYAIDDPPRSPAEIWPARVFTVGLTSLGLYNALVLSKDRYSHIDRFWQNVVALNASVAGGLIAGWLTGSNEWISPRVSFMVGPRADQWAVHVGGRF